MKKGLFLLTSVLLLLAACATQKAVEIPEFDVPLPPDINIVAPAPDLAKEIAAFSGKRKGIWDGAGLESILIIEGISNKEAKFIYAWGEGPNTKKGYSRGIAKVIPDSKPKIEFGSKSTNTEVKFVFEMQKDGTIKGTREFRSERGDFFTFIKMERYE